VLVPQATGATRTLWRFGRETELLAFLVGYSARTEMQLNVPARMLLDGDFTFCPISDFKGLSRATADPQQLCAIKPHDQLRATA
jgi:hypothetical protein